jgi:phosphoacetylglucosamine mutase
LSAGYAALAADADETAPPLVIDCADGVGGIKLAGLRDAVRAHGLTLDLRNRGDSPDASLNDGVGSDFVQKTRKAPARGRFDALKPGTRCVSVDGDADRLVYFETPQIPGEPVALVDGDQIAALVADFLTRTVREAAPYLDDEHDEKFPRVGVVQTAYANGASTKFLNEVLKVDVALVPTGVKHLHHRAAEMDVGVYFEANGHGTALFSEKTSAKIDAALELALREGAAPQAKALATLTHVRQCVNPAVGDAMSGILLVEAIARRRKLSSIAGVFYKDLASVQTKVRVRDRTMIQTTFDERRCLRPPGLQDAVDAVVANAPIHVRAFVRPSGTEDCVRVYVEASDASCVDAVARDVENVVAAFCA